MKNKIIIIAIAIVAVIAIAGLLAFFFGRPSSTGPSGGGNGTNNEISVPTSGAPSSLQIPSGDSIQIGTPQGTVTVNNFYKNIVSSEDEFITLLSTPDYQITYDTSRSSFYIDVLSNSVITARTAGEAALLGILGVDHADACKLSVVEGFPPGSSVGGQGLGLSFCSGTPQQ